MQRPEKAHNSPFFQDAGFKPNAKNSLAGMECSGVPVQSNALFDTLSLPPYNEELFSEQGP
jgi:hypothetical protein